jgi:hypothetical protein
VKGIILMLFDQSEKGRIRRMKNLWDPIVETVEDVQRVASRLIDDGVEFFRGHLGRIQLFSASKAIVGAGHEDRDEQHYFLVPNRGEDCGYCLYSMRVLPDGIGPENNLPKARVFQIPSEGVENQLIELLVGELETESLKEMDLGSPLADRLEVVFYLLPESIIHHQAKTCTGIEHRSDVFSINL